MYAWHGFVQLLELSGKLLASCVLSTTAYLCVDLTHPGSIAFKDIRLCQAREGSIVKNRHVLDAKCLLVGNIHGITCRFGPEMEFVKGTHVRRVTREEYKSYNSHLRKLYPYTSSNGNSTVGWLLAANARPPQAAQDIATLGIASSGRKLSRRSCCTNVPLTCWAHSLWDPANAISGRCCFNFGMTPMNQKLRTSNPSFGSIQGPFANPTSADVPYFDGLTFRLVIRSNLHTQMKNTLN